MHWWLLALISFCEDLEATAPCVQEVTKQGEVSLARLDRAGSNVGYWEVSLPMAQGELDEI